MPDSSSHVEVPAAELPEEVAWQLLLADKGGSAVLSGIVIVALWKWMQRSALRQEAASDRREAQAATDRKTEREVFTTHLEKFTAAIHRVELAVVRSDEHNQAALTSMRVETHGIRQDVDTLKSTTTNHGERLLTLELGAGQSGVRRIGRGGLKE